MTEGVPDLRGIRVLAALNGLELFGHERGNIEVFKVLREMGCEVMVGINAKSDNHVGEELARLGFSTFPLPFAPQWSIQWVKKQPSIALGNVLAVLRCSWKFHRVVRIFRPTHIHLGSPLVYSYLFLALSCCRQPLIYRMGDCPPVDSSFNLRIWRMAMRRSVCIVSNSEFVRTRALMAGARSITVIHNLAPSGGRNDKNHAQDPVEHARINLVYVGAVSEHKGLIPLVEAFARLLPDYPDLYLDVVGGSRYDGEFRTRLVQLVESKHVEKKVLFHGYTDCPSSFYRHASIHVAPSVWEEPSGNVVLEAKHEGVPSVVFPSGGLCEMVHHQVDGFICAKKSVDALVEGLRWMLEDSTRLQRMGVAAREDSEVRFGRQRFVRAWAQVYRSVV